MKTDNNELNRTISLDEEEENLLVNDFVTKVNHSLTHTQNLNQLVIGFPEEKLSLLIEENA